LRERHDASDGEDMADTGATDREVDLVVLGAGAGGMSAALTGALLGLEVELLEKADVVGGTTALSAGSVWVPNTHHAPPGGDSPEQIRRYLEATVGERMRPEMREAFLTAGPEMVRFLEDSSTVAFHPYPHHPDYLADFEGATLNGRALEPLPFDGRLLGPDFRRLRDPLPEFTLFGGMMVNRTDIGHLLNATSSFASLRHALGITARYAVDRLRYHRGTRLVMGNALAGRLFHSLLRRGVAVRTGVRVEGLLDGEERVDGVTILTTNRRQHLRARYGVVLATGGFVRHPELRSALLPQPTAEYSPVVESATGDGADLGRAAGGRLGEGHETPVFWSPMSVRRRADGSTAVFPHFVLDRGKPGLIAVDSTGRRFVNEATTYHLFGQAQYAAHRERPAIPCHFICDHAFIGKYGLGMVRPRAMNLKAMLAEGYVTKADSLADLARALGIDAETLKATVARNNAFARDGVDADFGKGHNAYERNLGDPEHKPNPCLGPIGAGPYYAVAIYPGDIGASVGLVTDENARVLRADGQPVQGLYACGNDMDSIMAGVYPGPGITLGPALTFGYVAARHAARRNAPA
jgi:succinate dehydrogenase/fumarate reductase flavoprotein subunit